jgi:hypothetical protein
MLQKNGQPISGTDKKLRCYFFGDGIHGNFFNPTNVLIMQNLSFVRAENFLLLPEHPCCPESAISDPLSPDFLSGKAEMV